MLISGLNDGQKKFLNCFKKNYVPMTTNGIATILYPFWSLLFIVYLDMGIVGCAIADNVSILLTYLVNLIYTSTLSDLEEAVFMPRCEVAAGNFYEQLQISLWSIFNSVIEGYSWQLMILVTGYLSVED